MGSVELCVKSPQRLFKCTRLRTECIVSREWKMDKCIKIRNYEVSMKWGWYDELGSGLCINYRNLLLISLIKGVQIILIMSEKLLLWQLLEETCWGFDGEEVIFGQMANDAQLVGAPGPGRVFSKSSGLLFGFYFSHVLLISNNRNGVCGRCCN